MTQPTTVGVNGVPYTLTPKTPSQMVHSFVNKFLAAILAGGATVCLLFICISGSVDHFPFNEFYWLKVNTKGLSGSGGDVTKWTFWGICHPSSMDDSKLGRCPDLGPDRPLSPLDNFGKSSSLPKDFTTNRDTYYYLSRFAFPLLLVSLVFSGISFIGHIIAPCWIAMRQVTSLFCVIAMIFAMGGAATMTACVVMARKHFDDGDYPAKLGAAMMGMVWAAVACLILVFFIVCCSSMRRAYRVHTDYVANQKAYEINQMQYEAGAEAQATSAPAAVDTTGSAAAQQPAPAAASVPVGAAASNSAQPTGIQSPPAAQGSSQQRLSTEKDDYVQSQGALPSDEGGIRFFKIKRGSDQESVQS